MIEAAAVVVVVLVAVPARNPVDQYPRQSLRNQHPVAVVPVQLAAAAAVEAHQ